MDSQILIELYTGVNVTPPTAVDTLPRAGSNRHYFRLHGPKTMISVYGEYTEENHAFVTMATHFRSAGLPVPQIYAVSDNRQYYLQENLGTTSLFDCIPKDAPPDSFRMTRLNCSLPSSSVVARGWITVSAIQWQSSTAAAYFGT